MERAAALRKKRTFRKFLFRGVELEKLLDLNHSSSTRARAAASTAGSRQSPSAS